ncbi:MAG: ABC transporter permease [Candidatus Heimdallarchaeota archaeon]|nr:ABC transporter permease [Candidatus Heimdallarchaeota archaeon]MBY8994314.1 ABC transporter permease [Candidatus Heimdallarchaeota archaeon]
MTARNIGKKLGNFFLHLAHSIRRIGNHLGISVKLFYRSRLTVFLFLFYPIILLLLFGSIFAKQDLLIFNLGVQDNDATNVTQDLFDKLDSIDILNVILVPTTEDPKVIMQQDDLYACLVIPVNWSSDAINPLYSSSNATLILNSYSPSAFRVSHLVSNAMREFNIEQNGTQPIINVETENFISENLNYIDFFLPGIIGVIIMNTSLLGTINRQTHYKKAKLLRKFATTPLTRWEYVSAEITWQFLIAFIATTLTVFTAWIVFSFSWSSFSALIIPIVFVGSILFSGLGLLLSQIIRNPNNPLIVGFLITIPMLFLSGVFFDVSGIRALAVISKFSPLTFLVDALRSSMITNNIGNAWMNIGIALAIGLASIIVGVFLTKWERD